MKEFLKENRINDILKGRDLRGHKGQTHSYEMDFLQKSKLLIYFDIKKGEDDILINPSCEFVDFKDPLEKTFKDLTQAFLSLLDGVATEAIHRVGIKEFDFYLRKEQSQSSFTYYSKELYKILEIGEFLHKILVNDRKETKLFDPKINGVFLSLSFSEQIEFFEEFLSKYIYKSNIFRGQSFYFDDINGEVILINYTGAVLKVEEINYINEKFNECFKFSARLNFIHNPQ